MTTRRIAGGANFSREKVGNIGQSGAMQSAAAVALMLLLTFCCAHRSSDWQCFSIDRTTPKIAASLGDLDLYMG